MCLLLIGTGIDSINNKTVENDYQNNSETQEKDQSKNKSTIEISKSVTEKSRTNLIGSTTSTTVSIPQKKIVCRTNETNKIEKTVEAHTTGKTNNMGKILFTVPTIKKMIPQINQLELKKNSNYHDIEAVAFLDHINFDNGDFDDDNIDYISETI